MARKRSVDNPPTSNYEVKNSNPQLYKNLFKKLKRSLPWEQYVAISLSPQAPFPFADMIPDAQHHILQFCDVSTLGALGCCSKNTCKMTREDKIWEERLKQLFERRYDRAFLQIGISGPPKLDEDKHPLKLSLWPLRSTSLTAWIHSWVLGFWNLADSEYRDGDSDIGERMIDYFFEEGLAYNNPLMHSSTFFLLMVESLDEILDEDREKPKYQWLFENVPLWAYYNHAESAFKEGQTELDEIKEEVCEQTNRCSDCYETLWACECGGGDSFSSDDLSDDFSDDFSDDSANDCDSCSDSCLSDDSSDDFSDNSSINGGEGSVSHTNNNDTMQDDNNIVLADTSELPVWFMDRVYVAHGNGEIGFIHEINGSNKTATIVLENMTTLSARASDLTLLPPIEHDMVLVTVGADVGVEGELVCIDGSDAILKDANEDFKIVDFCHLVKIEQESY